MVASSHLLDLLVYCVPLNLNIFRSHFDLNHPFKYFPVCSLRGSTGRMLAPTRAPLGERLWRERKVRELPVFFRVRACVRVWFRRRFSICSTWIRAIFPLLSRVASYLRDLLLELDLSLRAELGFLGCFSRCLRALDLRCFSCLLVLFLATGKDSRSLHLLSPDFVRICSSLSEPQKSPISPVMKQQKILPFSWLVQWWSNKKFN